MFQTLIEQNSGYLWCFVLSSYAALFSMSEMCAKVGADEHEAYCAFGVQ